MNGSNKSQIEAINHILGPAIVIAGAGTGKTHVITQRIISLIQNQKVHPSNILALTFTNKASEEMITRIDKELPMGTYFDGAMTFHSFCEKLIRENSLYLGLSFDYQLLNQSESVYFFKEISENLSLQKFFEAGSKHSSAFSIINFFSRLNDETVDPKSLLNWTIKKINSLFPKEKTKLEELYTKLGFTYKDEWEYKYDKNITNKLYIKDEFVHTLGLDKYDDISDLDTLIQYMELSKVWTEYNYFKIERNFLDFGDLLGLSFKLLQNSSIQKKYNDQYKYILIDEFQDTNYIQYQIVKQISKPNNNIMVVGDDDQSIYRFRGASISNILTFKDDFPECKNYVLIENYRSSQGILDIAYKSIQNNNPYRLEEKLKINKKLNSNNDFNSEINFIASENEYSQAEYITNQILKLTGRKTELENYNPLVSKIYQNKVKNKQLALMSEDFIKLSDIAVLFRNQKGSSKLLDMLNKNKINYIVNNNRNLFNTEEVIFCLSLLKCATNFEDNQSFISLLNNIFIKINPRDNILIIQNSRRSHKSILLWLEENLNIKIGELEQNPTSSSLLNEYKISEDTVNNLIRYFNIISEILNKSSKSIPIENIVIDYLYKLNIIQKLIQTDTVDSHIRINNIEKFIVYIRKFEERFESRNILDFLEYVESTKYSIDSADDESNYQDYDAVNILTIHKSKGLEFDSLFIGDLYEKTFPSSPKNNELIIPDELLHEILPDPKESHYQEERRLFYVAVTRAKRNLYMLYPIRKTTNKTQNKISRFLSEIGIYTKDIKFKESKSIIEKIYSENNYNERGYNDENNKLLWDVKNQCFSYTKLDSYMECPFRFKLSYIDKTPTESTSSLTYGSIIHSIMQNMYRYTKQTGELLSKELSLKMLHEYLSKAFFNTKKENDILIKRGISLINNYYDKYYNTENEILMIEQSFKIILKDIGIDGKIDRVDKTKDGKYIIIDYKTGSPKEKKDVIKDIQLMVYYIAFENLTGIKPSELKYMYLEHNKNVIINPEKDYKKDIHEIVYDFANKVIKGIENNQFEATPNIFKCKNCSYQNICPHAEL